MKKLIKHAAILLVAAIIFTSCTSTSYVAQSPAPYPGPVTYQSFYDNLSPYGNWIDYPGYGHVWNPRAEAGFRPYATNGQWRYSNEGWAWQSNYNWGWAPFHYGRWLYDDNYGWLWVPGYDWSPAWVTWGSADNYYAWAPLMPEVNAGVRYGDWRPHSSYWNVVPREHVADRNLTNVIIRNNNSNNTTIINNTNVTNNITKNITIINNYNTSRTNNYYAKGPDVNEVQKYTRSKIEPVSFKEVNQINRPGTSGNVIEVYRPVVQNPHAVNGQASSLEQPDKTRPANGINNSNNNADNNHNNNFNNNAANTTNNHRPDNGNAANGGNNASKNLTPAPQENTPTMAPVKAAESLKPISGNNRPVTEPQPNNNGQAQPQPRFENQQNHPAQSNPGQVQNQINHLNQPQVQNPQPRVFRRVDAGQTRPIRNENEQPSMQPRQQRRNVEQLPVQRGPVNGNNDNSHDRKHGRQ